MLFIRASQKWVGKASGIGPLATVIQLPGWPSFDMFTAVPTKDPDVPGSTPEVKNPVTDAMLNALRYWPVRTPVTEKRSISAPGITVAIIDTAGWYGVYKGMDTGQFDIGVRAEVEERLFNGLNAAFGGLDRSKYGTRLADILDTTDPAHPFFREIKPYPSTEWFQVFAQNVGWHFHEETGPVSTQFLENYTSVIIINLVKLFRDTPLVNGLKPATYTFRILPPVKTKAQKGTMYWTLEGTANGNKVSVPPKPTDGRRDFPLEDLLDQPYDSDRFTDFLYPSWTPFPDSQADIDTVNPGPGGYVEVRVRFGAATVKPLVVFIDHTNGGGSDLG